MRVGPNPEGQAQRGSATTVAKYGMLDLLPDYACTPSSITVLRQTFRKRPYTAIVLLSTEPGHYTTMVCLTSDCCRVRKAAHNSGGDAKQARKKIRASARSKGDRAASKEGPSYEPGGF
ncbi:hypothetical protein HPB50_026552 [Hyalomma asiaticum]|uniref:Uncharacterized protein n=1 Tax=Hyalomma asiaticum TaxID=266040 RepID=A0ACB7TRP4_HYAAI|nr:hypothetical protein HPB50_026552 [Hyalomma asiaticum]